MVDRLREIGKARGATVAQIGLAWLLTKPVVASIIIGATKIHQLEDNLGATGRRLSEDQMQRLNRASEPSQLPYPYDVHRARLGI